MLGCVVSLDRLHCCEFRLDEGEFLIAYRRPPKYNIWEHPASYREARKSQKRVTKGSFRLVLTYVWLFSAFLDPSPGKLFLTFLRFRARRAQNPSVARRGVLKITHKENCFADCFVPGYNCNYKTNSREGSFLNVPVTQPVFPPMHKGINNNYISLLLREACVLPGRSYNYMNDSSAKHLRHNSVLMHSNIYSVQIAIAKVVLPFVLLNRRKMLFFVCANGCNWARAVAASFEYVKKQLVTSEGTKCLAAHEKAHHSRSHAHRSRTSYSSCGRPRHSPCGSGWWQRHGSISSSGGCIGIWVLSSCSSSCIRELCRPQIGEQVKK